MSKYDKIAKAKKNKNMKLYKITAEMIIEHNKEMERLHKDLKIGVTTEEFEEIAKDAILFVDNGGLEKLSHKNAALPIVTVSLPSDNEIEKRAEKEVNYCVELGIDPESLYEQQGFEKGAKWMRDLIGYDNDNTVQSNQFTAEEVANKLDDFLELDEAREWFRENG